MKHIVVHVVDIIVEGDRMGVSSVPSAFINVRLINVLVLFRVLFIKREGDFKTIW